MLYGRLEDNSIVEIINVDPTGRYHPDIVWVQIPDEFGLLTTKEKNDLVNEVKDAQRTVIEERAEDNLAKEAELKKLWFDIQREMDVLRANDVDPEAVYQASLAPPEEEAAAEEEAAEEEEAPAE